LNERIFCIIYSISLLEGEINLATHSIQEPSLNLLQEPSLNLLNLLVKILQIYPNPFMMKVNISNREELKKWIY